MQADRSRDPAKYKWERVTIPPADSIKVETVKDGLIAVTIDGKPFTAFNFKKDEPRPYLYPVIGPTGEPVTRDYPMKDNPVESKNKRQDHPHHRSIWTAHGDIRTRDFEHEGSNYWVEHQDMKFNDVQRVTRIVHAVSGPVFGQIEAEVEWIRHDGRRELTDTRTYTFFRGDDDSRIIDVQVMFHFPDEDVMFADTKEGGVVAMRIATSMDETAGGHMVNSKGQKGEKECWGKPAEWCDYVGKVKDETVGIAVFDAKDNFRHPTCWHIRGYGLYTANPFGLGAFTGDKTTNGSKRFKKGESAKFNYRIVIHKGDTQSAHIAEQYQLYADAPKITLK